MRKEYHIANQTLINQWIASKPNLAALSQTAYRGEVLRMFEYMERKGVSIAHDISRDEWWAYLESLLIKRELISTKRCDELKIGSVNQARRITRDFLMWALDQEFIDWVPKLPSLATAEASANHERLKAECKLSKSLINVLLGKARPQGLKECRENLIFNLIFWAGLKPIELINLTISDLEISKPVFVYSSFQNRQIYLPNHIAAIWDKYIQARNALSGEIVKPNDPLVSQLEHNQKLSGWSIWSIFQEWHLKHKVDDTHSITPRGLRGKYFEILCIDGDSRLGVACAIGGLSKRVVEAVTADVSNHQINNAHKQVSHYLVSAAVVSPHI